MMDKELIINEFNRIKALGYLKSRRTHNTGIGKTFEDYLGVDENNNKAPDFAGFEVKSKRAETSSYLTLFTKSPSQPPKVNTYLRDTYGESYEDNPNLKRLHTSIFSSKCNTYRGIGLCVRTCRLIHIYVKTDAYVRIGSRIRMHIPTDQIPNQTSAEKQMRLNKILSSRTIKTNSFISICLIS